jgi:deazaflavin-dependent oxidoreductase (nitroreductase family)
VVFDRCHYQKVPLAMAQEESVQKRTTWSGPMPIPEFDALQHARVLYLTTIGRSSGKPRTIEIWFVSYEGRLYVLAEHGLKAQWVRNIQANPDVTIQIAQHCFRARGRILDDDRDRHEWQAIAALSRRKYGWGDGLPVAFDVYEGHRLENS